MPVPFETLIPYGIIVAMFGITGTGLHVIKYVQNGGKKPRWGLDQWDRQSTQPSQNSAVNPRSSSKLTPSAVMDRDRRLTGDLRGQVDNAVAPPGFELNNPWRLEKRMS